MKNPQRYIAVACIAFQAAAQAPSYSQAPAATPDIELTQARERIAALELELEKIGEAVYRQRAAESAAFNWALQNELRHFHGAKNPERSFYHCDVILRNSVMDDYILNTLGHWAKEEETQVKNLLESARRYPSFGFITAACSLRAAEVTSDKALRLELVKRVASLEGDELETYRTMARTILKSHAE